MPINENEAAAIQAEILRKEGCLSFPLATKDRVTGLLVASRMEEELVMSSYQNDRERMGHPRISFYRGVSHFYFRPEDAQEIAACFKRYQRAKHQMPEGLPSSAQDLYRVQGALLAARVLELARAAARKDG